MADGRSLALAEGRSLRSLMAASGFALAVSLKLTLRSFHNVQRALRGGFRVQNRLLT